MAVPGVMKKTTTAAMEVLLGLPHVHVINEVKAQAAIDKLMHNHQRKPTSTDYCHTKKPLDMEHEPILLIGNDKIILICI
jgi:hypothetical protein